MDAKVRAITLEMGWSFESYRETDMLYLFDIRQGKRTVTIFVRKTADLSDDQLTRLVQKVDSPDRVGE